MTAEKAALDLDWFYVWLSMAEGGCPACGYKAATSFGMFRHFQSHSEENLAANRINARHGEARTEIPRTIQEATEERESSVLDK